MRRMKLNPSNLSKETVNIWELLVITEIQKTTEQTTPEGDIISIQIDLKLREYTGTVPEDEDEDDDKGFKTKS